MTLTELNDNNWSMFAKQVCGPNIDPYEHSPQAIDNLMTELDDDVVRMKGIHPQFNAINKIEILNFETAEGRKYYNDSVERYQRKVARAQNNPNVSAKMLNIIKLVAFLQYRIGAETNPDRISFLGRETDRLIKHEGKSVIVALNFKQAIINYVEHMINNYGYTRKEISLIWGGGIKAPTQKQKAKANIEQDEVVMRIFKEKGISMDDLGLDDVEALAEKRVFPDEWRLNTQSKDDRQQEIDRFQIGKTLICAFTAKSGGVGLSLHHSDEFTKEKVRRKESGYAYEEDIPLIPVRPRETLAAPSWSAIELVQLLGRGPRLTSLSDTIQRLNFFRGTEEERVAHIVSMKLKCLSKVVRQKESWEGVIMGGYSYEEVEQAKLTDESEADVLLNGDIESDED